MQGSWGLGVSSGARVRGIGGGQCMGLDVVPFRCPETLKAPHKRGSGRGAIGWGVEGRGQRGS